MPVTNVDVANSALMKLGAKLITSLSDNSVEAIACNARLEACKRSVLRAHPWNFATKRAVISAKVITGAANNGSGLIRITSTSHGFVNGNSIFISGVTGTAEANGTWTISGVTANTFDLVGSAFVNTYVSGGSAAIAAAFDYSLQLALPSDFLRLVLLDEGDTLYRLEGGFIVTNSTSVNLKYIFDVTDYNIMDAIFHEALAYYLAWDVCYRITQNMQLRQSMLESYEAVCKRAKFVNAVEEPADAIQADDFLESRISGARAYVRDPLT